jgi:class 3 adenylate cyclase
LEMVPHVPKAGLPPAHIGVAAGPVVANGGDYLGRTVNLASRNAGRARAGHVLVSESVANAAAPDVRFVELGEVNLKGFAKPVRVFEARRIPLDEGRLDPLADGSIPPGPYAGNMGIDRSRRSFGPLLSGPEEPRALLVPR